MAKKKKKNIRIKSKVKSNDYLYKTIKKLLTKINLKKVTYTIIIFLFIGLVNYYRDIIIKFIFEPKPRIIVNITKVEPLELDRTHDWNNFNLLFGSYSNIAIIVVAKLGNLELNKLYGMTYVPNTLLNPELTKNYSISLKNISSEVAQNITIDIKSIKDIEILEHDPKIKFINCGGSPKGKSCYLEISSLASGEEVSFCTLNEEFEKEDFQLRINGKTENVNLNFRSFKIMQYNESMDIRMNGIKIIFPPINKLKKPKIYYYWQEDNTWREINLKS